jgi:hypothetical protein
VRTWADPGQLAAWTLDNLDGYWRRLLGRASRVGDRWSVGALTSYGAVWIVLGVSRLHYTLTTGEITSKEDAGRYALAASPTRWHPLIRDCLHIRRADGAGSGIPGILTAAAIECLRAGTAAPRPLYRTPVARRRDVLAFGAMAIADAHRVPAGVGTRRSMTAAERGRRRLTRPGEGVGAPAQMPTAAASTAMRPVATHHGSPHPLLDEASGRATPMAPALGCSWPPVAAGSIGWVAVQALSWYGLVAFNGWNSYRTPTW